MPNTDKLIEPVWIGHYITGFDLRFLWQRYVIKKVIPLVNIPFDAKPWDKTVYDTKIKLSGMHSTGFGSLDEVSKIMGHLPKGDITGATVWDAWLAGRYDDIAEYCKSCSKIVCVSCIRKVTASGCICKKCFNKLPCDKEELY